MKATLQNWIPASLAILTMGLMPMSYAEEIAPPVPAVSSEQLAEMNGKLLEELSGAIGTVKYFLLPDETGDRPEMNVGYLCPNCNRMHTKSAKVYIEDQRPLTAPVFAVAPNAFISQNTGTMPSWIDKIEVVFKGKQYPAKIAAYYPDQDSLLLETDTPIDGVVPLTFAAPEKDASLFVFGNSPENGVEMSFVQPYSAGKVIRETRSGKSYVPTPGNVVLVDKSGKVCGLSMVGRLSVTESITTPPSEWKRVTPEEYFADLKKLEARVDKLIFPIQAKLKNSKKTKNARRAFFNDDAESRNEISGFGILLEDGRVLASLNMNPEETMRLQRLTARVGDHDVPLKFESSLAELGAITATPEKELDVETVKIVSEPITDFNNEFVFQDTVRAYDKKVDQKIFPKRLTAFSEGFKGITTSDDVGASGEDVSVCLFSTDGRLLGIVLPKRSLNTERWYSNQGMFIPGELLLAEINNPDPINVPGEGEAKTAYLGVTFQELDKELARSMNLAEITQDGETGMLINGVEPGSPAAKLGLKDGDILISISPENSTKVETLGSDFSLEYMMGMDFPWERYDELPAEYFEMIPTPWPSVENKLNKLLTRIGIGRKAKLRYIRDGKVENATFVVEVSPDYFEVTEKYQLPGSGMSVCVQTYEVRDYFKLKNQEGGMVISTIKPGSAAAVAGLKPYELIMDVDDVPVATIEEFKKATEGKEELRLNVKRQTSNRIVILKPKAGQDEDKTSNSGKTLQDRLRKK